MSLLVCLIVGLATGALASRTGAAPSGYGIAFDGLAGIGGAFVACIIFAQLGWLPDGSLVGALFVAFIGGVAALVALRGVHRVMA